MSIRDDDLILYHYRDGLAPERLREIASALAASSELAARYQRLRQLLAAADADALPPYDPDLEARLWQRLQQPMLWRVLWFGGGWMTMLMGGAALGTYAMRMGMVRSYDVPAIVMLTALGFGMVTLPLALREMLRRDGTQPSR